MRSTCPGASPVGQHEDQHEEWQFESTTLAESRLKPTRRGQTRSSWCAARSSRPGTTRRRCSRSPSARSHGSAPSPPPACRASATGAFRGRSRRLPRARWQKASSSGHEAFCLSSPSRATAWPQQQRGGRDARREHTEPLALQLGVARLDAVAASGMPATASTPAPRIGVARRLPVACSRACVVVYTWRDPPPSARRRRSRRPRRRARP